MIYVLSDIHGDMDAIDSILSQIQLGEDDHLYIISDVIDRGPHSIELLQRIRKMRNTTMLLGNHEYMMTDRLRHPEDRELAALWYRNGGGETETSFEKLSADEQEDLLQYLEGLERQDTMYLYANSLQAHSNAAIDVRVNKKGKYADALVNPAKLELFPETTGISKRVREICAENVFFAFIIKAILLFLALTGNCSVWFAIFLDFVAAIATILNTIRVTKDPLIDLPKI